MKKKMKRQEVLNICGGLANGFHDIRNTKFAYALQKNIRAAKPIETELNKKFAPSEEIKKYEIERLELCKRFSKKDKSLNPVTKDGRFIIDNKHAFDKELDKLRFKFGTAIRLNEAKKKELDELLEVEVEVEFHRINQKDLPDNLSIQQLELLDPIILED